MKFSAFEVEGNVSDFRIGTKNILNKEAVILVLLRLELQEFFFRSFVNNFQRFRPFGEKAHREGFDGFG